MLFQQTGSESKVHWGEGANHPHQSGQSTFSNRPLRELISCIQLNSDLQHVANFKVKNTQLENVHKQDMKMNVQRITIMHIYLEPNSEETHIHTLIYSTSPCPPVGRNILMYTKIQMLK